jgi:polyisoprenoid-binding protein YceI
MQTTSLSSLVRTAAAALLLAGFAARAVAAEGVETWTPDLVHSRAEFLVSHLIVSKVWGHVPIRELTLQTAPNGIPTTIDAQLVPGKLDTDNHERDADLRSPNYFDIDQYPAIAFVSTAIHPIGADRFACDGDLTIRGVTKRVTLAGHVEGRVPDPAGERIGYTATVTIDRRDFGITDARLSPVGIPLVGNDVAITLTVEATRPK